MMPDPIIEGSSYILSCSCDYGSPLHDYLEEEQIPDFHTMIDGDTMTGTKTLTRNDWYTLKYVSQLTSYHPTARITCH